MYISLQTARQLKQLKDRLLWVGLFMLSGGAAAFLHNTLLLGYVRWGWAMAAMVVLFTGLYLLLLSTDTLRMKDTYVTITPFKVSYRLHFYWVERCVNWQHVSGIQLNESCVLFNLQGGKQKMLNLRAISSPSIASQVAVSLYAEALKQNLHINSFQTPVSGTTNSY